jgi:hypothetical protein
VKHTVLQMNAIFKLNVPKHPYVAVILGFILMAVIVLLVHVVPVMQRQILIIIIHTIITTLINFVYNCSVLAMAVTLIIGI